VKKLPGLWYDPKHKGFWRGLSFELSHNRVLYLMVLPAVLLTLVYRYLPMLFVVISFQDYSFAHGLGIMGIINSPFVGFKHFAELFTIPDFGLKFTNTLVIGLGKQIINFSGGLMLALLLYEMSNRFLRNAVRVVTLFPYMISWAVAGAIFSGMMQSNGLFNAVIARLAPGASAVGFLIDPRYFKPIIILTEGWKYMGLMGALFYASLLGIDITLYEFSSVDGASRWDQFLHITLPSIRTTMIVVALLNLQYIVNVGPDQVLMFLNPNVYSTGDIIPTYVYRQAIFFGNYSWATAVGLSQSVLAFIMVIFANSLARKFDENRTGLW